MVQGNDSDNPQQMKSKGVNVTSDSLPAADQCPCNPATVRNLRNQVQTLINQMGPATPHLTQNSSSEADNEESVYETTSVFSSVYKAKTEVRAKQTSEKTDSSTREVSECSALPPDDISAEKETKHCCGKHCRDSSPPPRPPPASNRSCCCPCKTNYDYFARSPPRFHISRKEQDKKCFLSRLLCRKQKSFELPMDLYKMDVAECEDRYSPPRKLIFNLVEGVPEPQMNSVGINTRLCSRNVSRGVPARSTYAKDTAKRDMLDKDGAREYGYRKQTITKTCVPLDGDGAARVDVYYFDHGNSGYYETTDCIPYIMTEMLADKTETYTTKFWAELFGTVHIGFSFCTSFILQFFRFILYSIVRPLTIGLIQLASDYFFKPCLAVMFNAVIQPPLIFIYNIATSLRDLCDPFAEGIGYFLREIAMVLRAIRLVEIRKGGKCCVGDRKSPVKSCQNTTCEIGSEVPKCTSDFYPCDT